MSFFFFFLMIRRPPRSTLFPTRRSSDLVGEEAPDLRVVVDVVALVEVVLAERPAVGHEQRRGVGDPRLRGERSEEHTSELQSPCNLVCRLLLEKKKKRKEQKGLMWKVYR